LGLFTFAVLFNFSETSTKIINRFFNMLPKFFWSE
jgi:hypothetical protein